MRSGDGRGVSPLSVRVAGSTRVQTDARLRGEQDMAMHGQATGPCAVHRFVEPKVAGFDLAEARAAGCTDRIEA